MDILYIVMPAYNEEENIETVIRQWYPFLDGKADKSRLVVADNGSTDLTHSILLSLQKELPKLEIISDTDKFHGPKVIALYDYAISKGADYVFQTDSDGQTNPSEFDDFWKLRLKYDGIFGNRIVREDGKDRAFVEKVVCVLLKLFFYVNIPDANAPFRLMKCNVLKKYLHKMDKNYNLPNIMIATFFVFYNEKILFKEITFKSRAGGTGSLNLIKIVKIGINALKDFYGYRLEMKK